MKNKIERLRYLFIFLLEYKIFSWATISIFSRIENSFGI